MYSRQYTSETLHAAGANASHRNMFGAQNITSAATPTLSVASVASTSRANRRCVVLTTVISISVAFAKSAACRSRPLAVRIAT
jgi:hypothetical protein